MCFLSTTLLNAPAYHPPLPPPLPPLLFDHFLTFWINVEVERRGGISYFRTTREERLAPADSN